MSEPCASSLEACARCGGFAALRARGANRLCVDCFERTRSRIETDPLTSGSLLAGTFELVRRVWLPALLVSAVVGIPVAIGAALVDLGSLQALVQGFWFLLATAAVLDLGTGVVAGSAPRPLGALIRLGVMSFPALVLVRLQALLRVGLGLLLLIVPGVIWALDFALIYPIALREGESGKRLLAESTRRMRGHRLRAFLAFAVLGVISLGLMLTAGVIAILALGFITDLDQPGQAGVVRAVAAFLGGLLQMPATLMLVVLDAKLRPGGPLSSSITDAAD